MAEFVVNTVQMNNCASQISSLQRELDSVAARLAGMQLGSVLQIRASSALIARVGDCKWAAVHQSDNLGKLARGLEEVVGLYDRCETNLSEPKTQAQAESQGSGSGADAEEEDNWNLWDAILDNIPWLDALGAGTEFILGELVGLGRTVTNWSNAIFAFIGSTIDNVEEFAGDLFSFRFLYELAGETAVDFGLGALASWAVGGLLTLAGVANPAAWAIAGGAALVWIGDVICTWINGEGVDISEWVVDTIWEGGEWVAEQVSNAVDAAGEFISDAADAAGEFINDAADAAGEFINDAVDAAGEFIEDAGEAVDHAFDVVQDGAEAIWHGTGEFFDSITPW